MKCWADLMLVWIFLEDLVDISLYCELIGVRAC